MAKPAAHRARKRFGQHFLQDRNVIERIVQAIDPRPGERLLEIGPGQGALTYALLQRCDSLLAIELDRDLLPLLAAGAERYGRLEIVNADILEFKLSELPPGKPWRLAGNLPYNISTPLMFHLLESAELIADMHFMLQKEVALRLVAGPGDANYGRLSVMMGYRCRCSYLFDVAPGCFNPPPRVDSAVVRLVPFERPEYEVGDLDLFSRIVAAAFNQRRKTIGNSLKGLVERGQFEQCAIDPGLRAENLAVSDFARLSRTLSHD